MDGKTSRDDPFPERGAEPDAYRDAFEVLLEARDRLLRQMSEDVLSNREAFLDSSGGGDALGFELQEIEDRYSARLSALNALIDNLEYRRPRLEHRVRVVRAPAASVEQELARLVKEHEEWDIVGLSVSRLEGDRVIAVVAFTSELYEE
jgi:hypothetical protein